MSLKRTAAKRDENEPKIISSLKQVGATVKQLSERGVPDLLVGYRGKTFLLEVKLPAGPAGGTSGRELTDDQKEFFETWRGQMPVVVRSADEALKAIGAQ